MTQRPSRGALVASLSCLLIVACGGGPGPLDGSVRDAGPGATPDGGFPDTGTPPSDGGTPPDDGGGLDPDAGTIPSGPLFDMGMIADPSTASCTFTNRRTATRNGVSLDLFDVSYTSWESIDGALVPITIRGYAAKPRGATGPMPGVVQAHGLGGFADEANATGPAALLGMFVIAYTGPGGGDIPANTSEGRPAGFEMGRRMFDTVPDPRGTWFWGHSVAGMRGITCLTTRAEVDSTRLGMTGYSAGGVATLISSGADDRIVASVPLSASLRWEIATESPYAWQHDLLTEAGYDTSSPQWLALVAAIDAEDLLGTTNTAIWMVNGTSDEFFPLPAHMATYDAFDHQSRRLSFVGNGDHGCLLAVGVPGVDSASDIQARADLRAQGAQRAWFHHHFGTDSTYSCIPAEPTLTATPAGATTALSATVDESCGSLDLVSVDVWWSGDGGLTYISTQLDRVGAGSYAKLVPPIDPSSVIVADALYSDGALVFPERLSVSSRPRLPASFVPRILSTTCALPP